MKTVHQGYQVSGMVGQMSATITEEPGSGGYVEVILTDGEHSQSYDLGGLQSLITDLCELQALAHQVEKMNAENRSLDT